MTGPKLWDELGFANFPARGRDSDRDSGREATLRIGDAERNRVTETLHEHYAQGRLTKDELDERLDATLAAKTYADLEPITADLPEPSAPEPSPSAGRAGRLAGFRGAFAGPMAFVAIPVGLLVTAIALMVALRVAFFLLPILLIAWLVMAILGHGPGALARRDRRRTWNDGGQFNSFRGGWGYSPRYYGKLAQRHAMHVKHHYGHHYGNRFGNR